MGAINVINKLNDIISFIQKAGLVVIAYCFYYSRVILTFHEGQ